MSPAPRPTWLGYVLLVLTTAAWGGAWVTARLAAHEMPPLTVTWGRFAVAGLALLPMRFLLERGRRLRVARRDWIILFTMSVTGIAGYTIVFMEGVARAPASDGAIITPGLVGALAMAIAAAVARRMPTGSETLGALLAAAGVALVGFSAFRAAEADADATRVTGDLLFVASALLWAVYTVLGARIAGRVPAVSGVLLASAMGVAVLTPAVWILDGPPDPARWSRAGMFNVVYLGFVATALGFVTYYLAVRILGLNRAMPGLGLVPFFGVLGAAVFLGEAIGPLHAAGGALVIAGIAVPARARSRAPVGPQAGP